MNPIYLVAIVIILLLIFGGGFMGYRGNMPFNSGYGIGFGGLGGLLILLLILYLLGVFR